MTYLLIASRLLLLLGVIWVRMKRKNKPKPVYIASASHSEGRVSKRKLKQEADPDWGILGGSISISNPLGKYCLLSSKIRWHFMGIILLPFDRENHRVKIEIFLKKMPENGFVQGQGMI